MSHLPLPSQKPASREGKAAEEYTHFVSLNAVPRTVTGEQIQEETKADKALQLCMKSHHHGPLAPSTKRRPPLQMWKPHWRVYTRYVMSWQCLKLTVWYYVETRIVVSSSLQQHFADVAHEGHQGLVKTKKLMREKLWFSGTDIKMVKRTISMCIPCPATTVDNSRESLQNGLPCLQIHGKKLAWILPIYRTANTCWSSRMTTAVIPMSKSSAPFQQKPSFL